MRSDERSRGLNEQKSQREIRELLMKELTEEDFTNSLDIYIHGFIATKGFLYSIRNPRGR